MASIRKHTPSPENHFKPLPVKQDKVNKAFTNNYFLLSQSLTESQNSIYKYIITKVNTIGYIKINYQLIDNYRKVVKMTKPTTLHSKNTHLNVSRKKIVEDIIFLIEVGALVRIFNNSGHFILNPCYVFTKANAVRESTSLKYAEEWVKIMSKPDNYIEKQDFGMRYYRAMSEDRINKAVINHYTEAGKIRYRKGDKMYQTVCKILDSVC